MSADVPRRPPPGWRGGAPPPANPSLTKTGSELLRSLASVTQSVSASTRELWINPMKEIARDLGGDVKEAFRPGGAADAHAALRAAARGASAPVVVSGASSSGSVVHRGARSGAAAGPSSAASASTAQPASGFRGGIGWEPARGSAGEQLDTIFASLESRDDRSDAADETFLDDVSRRGAPPPPDDVEAGIDPSDPSESDRSALLRDETAEAFARLAEMRRGGGGGGGGGGTSLESWVAEAARRAVKFAADAPAATLALAAFAALAVVVVLLRDHAANARLVEERRLDGRGSSGVAGEGEAAGATPRPPLPPSAE